MRRFILEFWAVSIGIGISTLRSENTASTRQMRFTGGYFTYVGPNFTITEIRKPYNYVRLSITPTACPFSTNLCWIYVDESNIYGITDPFPGTPMVDALGTTIYNRVTGAEGTYVLPIEIIERKQ